MGVSFLKKENAKGKSGCPKQRINRALIRMKARVKQVFWITTFIKTQSFTWSSLDFLLALEYCKKMFV